LAVLHRARRGPQRPQAALPAWQGAGRLQQHQRHDLHARPGTRLRRLGPRLRRRHLALGPLPAHFKAHEDHWRGASPAHGAAGFDPTGARSGGEWRVEKQRLRWDILDAWAEAAVQAGIERTDDFNAGNNAGVGYFEVNQRRGWRWNTTKAFSAARTGTRRQPAGVDRFTGGAAQLRTRCPRPALHGAQVRTPQGLVQVRARQEVLLCSGAIGTPALLQRSGVGPAALLQQHGITVQHEMPGVGENLQDHLQVRAVYQVQGTRTLNTRANSLWGKAMIAAEYALNRSGPMSMAPSQLGAFVRSSPEREWPNLEYHVQPLSLDAFGEPLHRFDAITTSVCNLNPTSRGHVRITSPDPDTAPAIAPQLPLHRRRPPHRCRKPAPDAPHRGPARAGALPAAGVQARRAVPDRRRTGPPGR
jgi:choline dehydrogenase